VGENSPNLVTLPYNERTLQKLLVVCKIWPEPESKVFTTNVKFERRIETLFICLYHNKKLLHIKLCVKCLSIAPDGVFAKCHLRKWQDRQGCFKSWLTEITSHNLI
jgi:hypothetical protein